MCLSENLNLTVALIYISWIPSDVKEFLHFKINCSICYCLCPLIYKGLVFFLSY